MKKIARRNFLKLVGVSASIPILQSLPIASASATDLSDYPLLKDGIFDFENTDITQYVDDVQEVFGSEKDMIEEMLSSGELTPQDLKQHLLELAEQPSSVLVERGFSESQIAIIEEYDGIEDAFDYLYSTVSVTFSADVALQWKQVGMSINFTPQKKTTIIARGNATFKYNGQGYQTAGTV